MPRGIFEFFEELKANNSKQWWTENRVFYDGKIAPSFAALLDALGSKYGPWRIYRPRNDTRFAKNKPPYKNFIGAVTTMDTGTGHFVQFRATGLLIGSGYAMMAKDQLEAFRNALADDKRGSAFYDILKQADAAGLVVTGGRYERLKSAPKGYARDHPRIHWLRAKGVDVSNRVGRPEWVYERQAADRIKEIMRSSRLVTDWLDANVGASSLTPEEIWAPKRRTAEQG